MTIEPDISAPVPGDTVTFTAKYTPWNATDLGGSWQSSNPEVAFFADDSSPVLTVRALGETVVSYTANNGNRSATYDLRVTLPAAEVEVTATSTSIDLSWQEIGTAQAYDVWRLVDGGDAVRVSQGQTETSYSDTDIVSGHSYSYRIRAWVDLGEDGIFDSWSVFTEPHEFKAGVIVIIIDYPAEIQTGMESLVLPEVFTPSTAVDIEIAEVEGITEYKWYLNGAFEAEGRSITLSGSSPNMDVSQEVSVQTLMLTLVDGKGRTYSGRTEFVFDPCGDEAET